MFLATSFCHDVARGFVSRALASPQDHVYEPVLWIIEVGCDCLHVNYLQTDEEEFLFAPFSAFRVKAAEWQLEPTRDRPHKITLEAAADNRDTAMWPLELPLAPWA